MSTEVSDEFQRLVAQNRESIKLPEDENKNDWIAKHLRLIRQQIAALHGAVQEFCTCPNMSAGKYQFFWANEGKQGGLIKVSAREYTSNVLSWTETVMKDKSLFPDKGGSYPSNIEETFKSIARRLMRTFAHWYYHHIESIAAANLEKQFKASLKHCFYACREFSLVEGKDIGPLMHVSDKLDGNDSLLEVFRQFQEKEAALNKFTPPEGTRRRSHSVESRDANPKEREFMEWLRNLGLEDSVGQLRALGIREMNDLNYVEQEDLVTLPPISQRKLWLAVLDYQKNNEEFRIVDRQRSYTVTTAEDLPLHEKAWIKLRADLNLRLGGYIDIFKSKLKALIPADKWVEWGTTDAIDEALSYLRFSNGIAGLKEFKKILEELNQKDSLELINSSICSFLFDE